MKEVQYRAKGGAWVTCKSQTEAAQKSGIEQSYISRILKGEIPPKWVRESELEFRYAQPSEQEIRVEGKLGRVEFKEYLIGVSSTLVEFITTKKVYHSTASLKKHLPLEIVLKYSDLIDSALSGNYMFGKEPVVLQLINALNISIIPVGEVATFHYHDSLYIDKVNKFAKVDVITRGTFKEHLARVNQEIVRVTKETIIEKAEEYAKEYVKGLFEWDTTTTE